MKISVVTVCYNAADTLEETMLSVLNQTYDNIDYIIIDGGSTDGTVGIIRKYADRLAYWGSEPDKGIYDAMNKGLAVATGDYVNFMNAGDTFFDEAVVENVASRINKEGCSSHVIYGDSYIYDNYHTYYKRPEPLRNLRRHSAFCHQASFIKHGDDIKYDLNYRIAADYELFSRMYLIENKSFLYVPIPICRYKLFGISDNNKKALLEFYQISRRYNSSIWGRISFWGSIIKLQSKNYLKSIIGAKMTARIRMLFDRIS